MAAGRSRRHADFLADHLRSELIKAARELFAERGYQGAMTKDIAERAGVSVPTLFKYFGSKAELFEAAVAEPLKDWTGSLSTYWADLPLEKLIERYMTELYDVVHANRDLLKPLVAASLDGGSDLADVAKRVSADFTAGLATIVDSGRALATDRAMPTVDYTSAMGVEISMILGTVLLEDWVFPARTRRPGRARLIREMTRILYGGVTEGRALQHEPPVT
jgi:AcrR family transcriptional regulator